MNEDIHPTLPLWYRPWLILPLCIVALYILGMCLTLPPNMIDPRKYPAFMDGGTDWGGSNVFFYTRVVMLFMGVLGFLSVSCLKPQPDWRQLTLRSTAGLLFRAYFSHILCFIIYGTMSVLSDSAGDRQTWVILTLEIGGWYVLSAALVVSLLRRGINLTLAHIVSAVLAIVYLLSGFYLGYWVTGAGFDAHLISAPMLFFRLTIELLVYAACVAGTNWLMWKMRCDRFAVTLW
jgi:hypothetical protein